jgi:hypothetical protein
MYIAVRELPGEQNLDHVRVLEPRGHLGFPREAGDELGVRRELPVEHFHGDVAVDALLEGSVDSAHRADPCELLDLDVARDFAAQIGIRALSRARRARAALQGRTVVRTKQGVLRVLGAARRAHLRRERRGGIHAV